MAKSIIAGIVAFFVVRILAGFIVGGFFATIGALIIAIIVATAATKA